MLGIVFLALGAYYLSMLFRCYRDINSGVEELAGIIEIDAIGLVRPEVNAVHPKRPEASITVANALTAGASS